LVDETLIEIKIQLVKKDSRK